MQGVSPMTKILSNEMGEAFCKALGLFDPMDVSRLVFDITAGNVASVKVE